MRFFCLFFVSFLLFSFAFLVWKFDVLFIDLLVVVVFYGHSKQTRSLLLLDLYYSAWHAVCYSYHSGQRIFFTLCDCRSEGFVPANTLKRLVRKRKYKNIFS